MTIPGDERGPHGDAVHLAFTPDQPRCAQTVALWLITSPLWHPLWSQYALCCVRLDDHPDFPPPKRRFDGATHEIVVVALSPDDGRHDRASLERWLDGGRGLPYLEPANVVHQFTATDQEMIDVCRLAARCVVHGLLNPETGDAPDLVREQWLTAIVKTLAHARGEEHAP